MANISKLQRYWQRWEEKLKPLVQAKGAKLIFPGKLKRVGTTQDSEEFAPERPICITNAPMKASTRKRTSRLVIFINGGFQISKNEPNHCINHRSNITIFKPATEEPGRSLHLEMVDALHFDVDVPNERTGKRTNFHPIFHVQRGTSLEDETCRRVLADSLHLPAQNITIDQQNAATLGTPYLRVPTPQLDLFSVLTLVAADYFCNPGDVIRDEENAAAVVNGDLAAHYAYSSSAATRFVELLKLLRDETNFAREGASSSELRQRLNQAGLICTASWYPEGA